VWRIGWLKDLGDLKCCVEDRLKAVLNLRTVVELVERGILMQYCIIQLIYVL